jgi:hypothetical protein
MQETILTETRDKVIHRGGFMGCVMTLITYLHLLMTRHYIYKEKDEISFTGMKLI